MGLRNSLRRPTRVATWQEFKAALRQEGCPRVTAVTIPISKGSIQYYGGKFEFQAQSGHKVWLLENYLGAGEGYTSFLGVFITVRARVEQLGSDEVCPGVDVQIVEAHGGRMTQVRIELLTARRTNGGSAPHSHPTISQKGATAILDQPPVPIGSYVTAIVAWGSERGRSRKGVVVQYHLERGLFMLRGETEDYVCRVEGIQEISNENLHGTNQSTPEEFG